MNALRWLLLVPAALVVSVVANAVVLVVLSALLTAIISDEHAVAVSSVLAAAVSAFLAILTAGIVAPSRKVGVITVTSVVCSLLFAVFLVVYARGGNSLEVSKRVALLVGTALAWSGRKSLAGGSGTPEAIMAVLGKLIKAIGWVVFAITGLWGFFLCLGIISEAAGFWGIVAALFLGPVTFVAAPLYAGFAWGNWFPLVLNYGGGITAMVLMGIGSALDKGSD